MKRPRTHAGAVVRGGRAFTLIELLAALALLAVFIAISTPPVIQVLQESRRRQEAAMMDRIAESFERALLLEKCVPSTNAAHWVPLVAAQLSLPEDVVSSNAVGTARLLVFDPDLRLGNVVPATLPYHQGGTGASQVAHARAVLLSGLQDAYPEVPFHSSAGFSNLWNRRDSALPGDWPSTWSSQPGDLIVRRVDFSARFHEVVLNNLDVHFPAPFALMSNSLAGTGLTNAVAITNLPMVTRLLHGTPLRLNQTNGQAQVVLLVTGSTSFVFEKGRWSRRAEAGIAGPGSCGPLGNLVETFLSHPGWGTTAIGTSPESVVLGMFDMLSGCRDWAEAGFENENGNSKWEAPTARFVFDIAPQLMLSSEDLLGL